MKLQLVCAPSQERRKKRVKAIDHFKKCPACGCTSLIDVSPDVVCSRCDWLSAAWDVQRGGMDNPIAAAKEFGFVTFEPIAGGTEPTPATSVKIHLTETCVEGA